MKTEIKNKKMFWKFFAILSLVFLIGVLFGAFALPQEREGYEIKEISVDIEIDYGEGNLQSFKREIFWQDASSIETLKALERRHGIPIELRELSGGEVFVEGINGVRNTRNSFWQVWVNGEEIELQPEDYSLKNGDKILWRRM